MEQGRRPCAHLGKPARCAASEAVAEGESCCISFGRSRCSGLAQPEKRGRCSLHVEVVYDAVQRGREFLSAIKGKQPKVVVLSPKPCQPHLLVFSTLAQDSCRRAADVQLC
jgi:hypothetical protein